MTRRERILVAVVLVAAACVRFWDLGQPLFWVDEAESAINALTIVDGGLPVDHYLGQPIFENTLIEPWPESAEYEFRDSSYSRKGLATYHGWLPLYAMAASFRLHGVAPDIDDGSLRVKHDEREMERTTRAARLPSALFGMLFVLAAFGAAREMFGAATGWSVLIAAAFIDRAVAIAREARYYSATIALGMLCCWLAWRIGKRGRWRDWLLGALGFSLLFHTHVITFIVASLSLACLLPEAFKERRAILRAAVFGLLVMSATLPWLLWSGFLEQSQAIPRAWPHLVIPEDLFRFPLQRFPVLLLFMLGFGLLVAATALGGRLPPRFRAAFGVHRGATCFLGVWLVLGWLAFLFLMPAVSHVFSRMSLPMLGPGLLLSAAICASVARFVLGRDLALGAIAAFACFAFVFTDLRPVHAVREDPLSRKTHDGIRWLRQQSFEPGTRIYATPNNHLILTVYTGLPVQNVAPVRASYLDGFDHPVVLFQCVGFYLAPTNEMLRDALDAADVPAASVSLEQARNLALREATRRRLSAHFARVEGGPTEVPNWLEPVIAQLPEFTARELPQRRSPVNSCPAVFRGFPFREWADWWLIYFYRFVDPVQRSGAGLNYARRMQNAVAHMLPGGWTVAISSAPVADR